MAIVYIVRHGRAAASFTDDLDPGLDALGHEQAKAACQVLQSNIPLQLLSSPLRRARETAEPLAQALDQTVSIETRFAEIPSPGLSLEERGPWLRAVMGGRWSEQDEALRQWHTALKECLQSIREDTVIFSHFVAINAAVGIAERDDTVIRFRPDNGSITRIEVTDGALSLLVRGDEANTHVN